MEKLPKITIVTPSYNQGDYLEQTIRSILEQDYPNLEYIIMDGGSSDNSVEIIKRYANKLAHWQSERDEGQSDAIAKGFEMSTGEILGWINSDDFLLPDALKSVGEAFSINKDAVMLAGQCVYTEAGCIPICVKIPVNKSFKEMIFWGTDFGQMSTFWKKDAYQRAGGMDTSLDLSFDYDLFLRLRKVGPMNIIPKYLAACRCHQTRKTATYTEAMP
ncbi:MAG: glycosyltransferase family 2 protein, partial [Planctomycetota bacterium]